MEDNAEEKSEMPQGPTASGEAALLMELPIGEVSRLTGYTLMSLRRLEKEERIPQSTKRNGIRHWTTRDVMVIQEYRKRMVAERESRMTGLYKLGARAAKKKARGA